MRFSSLSYFFRLSLLLLVFMPVLPTLAQDQGDTLVPLEKKEEKVKRKEKVEDEKDAVQWENHESITNAYIAKFPKEYKYNVFPFQFNKTDVAYSSEIYADLDKYDKNKTGKSVFIHSYHTFGEEMSGKRAQETLDRYIPKYKGMAKALKGALIKNENKNHNGYLAKEFYITYQEESSKGNSFTDKTAIRVHLYATNYAIIEQVVTGSASDMFAYRFDNFFQSIKLLDGIGKSEEPIGIGWVSYTSPNSVFTIKTPPINKDYTPFKPSAKATRNRERLGYKIIDPVVGETLHYYVTSYKLSSRPKESDIKSLLVKNHISKFVDNMKGSGIEAKVKRSKDVTRYDTSIVVSPRRSLPYITKLIYSVEVKGKFVLVKEFFTGIYHYNSDIEKTFFTLTEFHPEQYKHTPKKKKKDINKEQPQKNE